MVLSALLQDSGSQGLGRQPHAEFDHQMCLSIVESLPSVSRGGEIALLRLPSDSMP